MPQLLQPKNRSRNPEVTRRRLACLVNGWPGVIPCEGKKHLERGWPRMPNSPADIERWGDPKGGFRPYLGTGLRVEGAMLVLDFDIDDAGLMRKLMDILRAAFPSLQGALQRTSGSNKLALFLRVSRPIGMRRTSRYGPGWLVEAFGSLVTRYFAIDGPHSVDGRFYAWLGGAPWDTRLDSLPVFDADDVGRLIDLCDEVLGAELPRIADSAQATTESVLHDLEPGQLFWPTEGGTIELAELERELVPGQKRTGLLSYEAWKASSRKDHCAALLTRRGRLVIVDFQDGVRHFWKADEAAPPYDMQALAEALRIISGEAPKDEPAAEPEPEPEPAAEPEAAAPPLQGKREPDMPGMDAGWEWWLAWLLTCYALTESGHVARLYATSGACLQTMTAFHDYYAMLNRPKPPPSQALEYATRIWRVDARRQSVVSHDMRPDMPFPIYAAEDGQRYKNTYQAVVHEGEGTVAPFLRFASHLLPWDEKYFLDWLAHKYQRPWVPGHTLIMVAATADGEERSGTGRGTLFKILERLFGRRYVAHLDFDILTGASAQGVYTDWMADNLLVVVDESREGSGRFGERRSAYEHLKSRCDTSARWMTVTGKGVPARKSLVVCSYIIATNHADALMLPPSDRRFAVLANGERLEAAHAESIYAWMDQPGNIAALSRWLRSRDISGFNATDWPPGTTARERMMEASESELDQTVREALAAMPGLVFTRKQLGLHIQNLLGNYDLLHSASGQAQLAMILRKRAAALRMPGGGPRWHRRVYVPGENQVRVYARRRDVDRCDAMSAEEVREEVRKNGLRDAAEDAGDPKTPD